MTDRIGAYLEKLSAVLLAIFLLIFPLALTIRTTESFALPKQFILIGTALLLLVIFGVKTIFERVVQIKRTPFDVPLILFLLACLLSAVFSVNRINAFVSFVTLFFSVLLYFLIVNTAKTKNTVLLLIAGFVEGATFLSILSALSFFKIYILPFSYTKFQLFSPLGTSLDQAIYLSTTLVLVAYLIYWLGRIKKVKLRRRDMLALGVIGLEFAIITLGVALTIYSLIMLQRPLILPYATGFQIAFAAISQDSSRFIQAFLFGSGYGDFTVDFTRFKQAIFNQNQNLWSLTFFKSSSFILELLATTGLVGLLTFLIIAYKTLRQRPLFIPLLFFFILSLFLPLSFITLILLFVLLGFFSSIESLTNKETYYDVELALVTLKSGLITITAGDRSEVKHGLSKILPFAVFVLILTFVGIVGFYTSRYAMANVIFQDSLNAASQNKGSEAYYKQDQALNLVKYSDTYHRVFSQTNLALARSLINSVPKGSSPSAQTSQTILTLIQQSISSGRTATSISPQTAINWQNLSSIYGSLIGFDKNADSFAILTAQQAIFLDPANPQEYLNLGSLYYQLQLWDKAEEQFRIAVNLKPDFAIAYYNLAHTLQQKQELKKALEVMQQVRELVKNDKQSLKRVDDEIESLKKGIATPPTSTPGAPTSALPTQIPPVAIPAPATPSPLPTATPTPVPTSTK